ncbi:MAG: ribosome-associated translation inhibitor RaiA [Pseudomonadota bacterium]
MHIQVKGKQIDIGAALTGHVESTLANAVSKYFDRTVDVTVTFSPDGKAFRCDCHVHLPTGISAQSSGRGQDAYAAFDQCADRIEKQLRRYKRRLRDHSRSRKSPVDAGPAQSYVLAAPQIEADFDEPETLQPVIVAETRETVQSLSVGEAVMQMELADRPFLMFRHDVSGRINLVYQRADGAVGWTDPAEQEVAVAR